MCIIELCTVVFLDYNVYADINLPQIWVETQSLSDLGDLCTFYVKNLHILSVKIDNFREILYKTCQFYILVSEQNSAKQAIERYRCTRLDIAYIITILKGSLYLVYFTFLLSRKLIIAAFVYSIDKHCLFFHIANRF